MPPAAGRTGSACVLEAVRASPRRPHAVLDGQQRPNGEWKGRARGNAKRSEGGIPHPSPPPSPTQYHQIARANALREAYAAEHGLTYHAVMRARTEMAFDFSGGWAPIFSKSSGPAIRRAAGLTGRIPYVGFDLRRLTMASNTLYVPGCGNW